METEACPPTFPRPPSSPPPPRAAAVDPSSPADRDADVASPALTGDGGLLEAMESSTADTLPDADIFSDAPEDQDPEEGTGVPSGPAVLTDELRDKIVRQVIFIRLLLYSFGVLAYKDLYS